MPKFPVPPGGHKLSGAFINSSAPQTNVYILNMFPKGRINSAKDSHLLTCSLILLAACAAQIFGLLQISTRKIWKMFLLFFFFFALYGWCYGLILMELELIIYFTTLTNYPQFSFILTYSSLGFLGEWVIGTIQGFK